MKTLNRFLLTGLLLGAFSLKALAGVPCAALVGPLPDPEQGVTAEITSAAPDFFIADPFVGFFLVNHCVVTGEIDADPSDPSVIIFKVRLPLAPDWNGNFFMGGDGGFAGSENDENSILSGITFFDHSSFSTTPALVRGYATATTDTGHQFNGVDESWALDDPSVCTGEPCASANSEPGHIDNEREINYGHRAIHLTAVTAKLVMDKHFGSLPKYSYFTSCSNGGRQGLWEATTYPDDFDGILVGAPWNNAADLKATQTSAAQHIDEYGPLPVGKLDLITATVLAKCDSLDGIVDGILNQPSLCTAKHYNVHRDLPKCDGKTDGPDCFTSREIQFIAQLYKGLPQLNSNNSFQQNQILSSEARVGFDIVGLGSSLYTWEDRFTTPTQAIGADAFVRYFYFDDANLDTNPYLLNTPIPHLLADFHEQLAGHVVPTTDLSDFMNSDGKVLFWHGWNDSTLPPSSTIKYYEDMVNDVGGQASADSFARLYMMPGVGHCADGPGPQVTNMAQVLVDWVEDSTPPTKIDAVTLDVLAGIIKGRPLCPYPMIAEKVGPDDWDGIPYYFLGAPSNFECALPE